LGERVPSKRHAAILPAGGDRGVNPLLAI
jgi:hypothetical protein